MRAAEARQARSGWRRAQTSSVALSALQELWLDRRQLLETALEVQVALRESDLDAVAPEGGIDREAQIARDDELEVRRVDPDGQLEHHRAFAKIFEEDVRRRRGEHPLVVRGDLEQALAHAPRLAAVGDADANVHACGMGRRAPIHHPARDELAVRDDDRDALARDHAGRAHRDFFDSADGIANVDEVALL